MNTHPLQSLEWARFREKLGTKVIKTDFGKITIHKIPKTNFTIGYFAKGQIPDKKITDRLYEIGEEQNSIFIQIEPNIKYSKGSEDKLKRLGFKNSAHPLFTKYNFILDLTKSEDQLLKNMDPKTRYNIKVAQKHGVKVLEETSDKGFEEYLKLTKETTKRQKFYAHSEKYHRLMWESLKNKIAHLFVAKYKNKILTTWIVFVYKDTLYYPYGASSDENRETMASNLMTWEVIRWGKKKGLKKFDMWGALGPNPSEKDPWFGFHRFKKGYGPQLIEYVGSYDLIIKPFFYQLYKIANKIRWLFLRSSI